MCFNATVSFGVGAVIGVIGIITLKKACSSRQFTLFAGIPLTFAIQQLVEGILWLTLKQPDKILTQQIATYIFIIIAQVIWPIWVPISILLLEKEKFRKKILFLLTGVGIISSMLGAYRILFHQIIVVIEEHHIKYIFNFHSPWLPLFVVFYILPTVVSPFVSSVKKMYFLGSLLLVSLIISKIFFSLYTVSVWCFFAAIISSVVLLVMYKLNTVEEKKDS